MSDKRAGNVFDLRPTAWAAVSTGEPTRVAGAAPATTQPAGTPSRRSRIWELAGNAHCPVVGVCLDIDVLRRLLDRLFAGKSVADDYDLHVGVVRECATRNKVSEVVQRELDRRYATVIRRVAGAGDDEALAALWQEAADAGDIAGTLWATLTHPRCSEVLTEYVLRSVHMLQHQAGAARRAGANEVVALVAENRQLRDDAQRQCRRGEQGRREHAEERERLQTQLQTARAETAAASQAAADRDREIASLRAVLGNGLETREQLLARNGVLQGRLRDLQAALADIRRVAPAASEATRPEPRRDPIQQQRRVTATAVDLASRAVLCVGGRSRHIPIYRQLVERRGGRFAHHDGGLEESAQRLDAVLAAADLVICQAGCVSHGAYGLVKEHCKRTGKRCVYLDNPSASSFARGLAQLPEALAIERSPAVS